MTDHYDDYHCRMTSPCPLCSFSFAANGPEFKSSAHWKVSSACLLVKYYSYDLSTYSLLSTKRDNPSQEYDKTDVQTNSHEKSLFDGFLTSFFWDRPDLLNTESAYHICIVRVDDAPPTYPGCVQIKYIAGVSSLRAKFGLL